MVHPVARSNRADGGSRNVLLWGLLMTSCLKYGAADPYSKRYQVENNLTFPTDLTSLHYDLKDLKIKDMKRQGSWGIKETPYDDILSWENNTHTGPWIPPLLPRRWDQALMLLLYAILGLRNVKLLVLVWMGSVQGKNLHQPYEWTLSRWEDSAIIQKKITAGSPSFTASLCTLAPISPCLDLKPFYFCPSSNPGKGYCNTPNQYYCAYWDCVTIASAWTPPVKDKFLKVEWGPRGCKPPRYEDSIQLAPRRTVILSNCSYLVLNVTSPEDPR